MKNSFVVGTLLAASLIAPLANSARAQAAKEPVDYVKPQIGGLGFLLTGTSPLVAVPYGMVRLMPNVTGGADRFWGTKISGFPAAGMTILPTTGLLQTSGAENASQFDRDFEVVTPYYGSEQLDKYNVKVEFTPAQRAAFYRITYPGGAPAHLLMQAADITNAGPNIVTGSAGGGGGGGTRNYFYAMFSKPFVSTQTYRAQGGAGGRRGGGGGGARGFGGGGSAGLAVDFDQTPGEQITVRVGSSYISVDEARNNLMADIPEQNFDAAKAAARALWSKELGKIALKGGTDNQRTIFYTALYRSMNRPVNYTETGSQYYSAYDQKVHPAEGHDYYNDDGLWDTYHCLHPLQLLLDPQRQVDMVNSLVRMYEQSGWLPTVPSFGGDRASMIGHHATIFITDAYMKGYRDFNVEKAYEGMRKNAMEASMLPWTRIGLTPMDRFYQSNGYFPALAIGQKETNDAVHPSERRQAVSIVLECCYDDWCLAQMAKALHKDDDYALFLKRSHNYQINFNKDIGFMAPHTADGEWVKGFDPVLSGGQGGRDYFTEMNAWAYTFNVQQDIPGLIGLLGGNAGFSEKMDTLFTSGYKTSKWTFLGQFPDSTGLVGQYAQGNEPSFHIPYLYNYVGEPWKSEFRLRQLMDVWYSDSPWGIPGDDDGGATSSWYVLSAMGFYQVTPGKPFYDIGSPLFEESRITLANGKTFTIEAHHASAQNKYVQSATLNGQPLNIPHFAHSAVANGGTLVLEMGPQPNKQWGSDAAAMQAE